MGRTFLSAVLLLTLWIVLYASPAAAAPTEDPPSSAPAAKTPAEAQPAEPKQETKGRKNKKDKDHAPESKEAREQRVISFVEQQNPELAKVLAHLKKRQPQQYDKAVHELARAVTILTNAKSNDARLYELELKSWQAKTRVDMLVAQSMVGKKDAKEGLEAKLREAVSEELKVKAEELAYRKAKSAAWYDRQIERLNENHDEMVEARLKKILGDKAGKPKSKRSAKAE